MNIIDKERIFVATFSNNAISVANDFEFGLEINDLCISSNLNPENRERVVARIKNEIESVYGSEWFSQDSVKRRKVIMHGPFTELTPDAIDERAIALMEERYNEALDICGVFGIKDLVLHDGYIPLIYQKSWHIKKSVNFWKRFLESIDQEYTIYIENVFDDEPETLTEIIDKIDMPNAKICLDVGHANCMKSNGSSVEEWINIMGERIGHLHLHNNDGSGDQHNTLSDGSMNMAKILEICDKKCSKNATITLESREALEDAIFLEQIDEKARNIN